MIATNLKGRYDGYNDYSLDGEIVDWKGRKITPATKSLVFDSLLMPSNPYQALYVPKQEGVLVMSPTMIATIFGETEKSCRC